MPQLTIREVEQSWIENARAESARRGISLNEVLLEALRRTFGPDPELPRQNGLEKFAGDSDFGQEWDDFLEHELKQIDETRWT